MRDSDHLVGPEYVGGVPRIMVLLDASSSMLDVGNGTMPGGPGTTGWDLASEALSGDVDWGGPPITWTFKDGTQDPPASTGRPTLSRPRRASRESSWH